MNEEDNWRDYWRNNNKTVRREYKCNKLKQLIPIIIVIVIFAGKYFINSGHKDNIVTLTGTASSDSNVFSYDEHLYLVNEEQTIDNIQELLNMYLTTNDTEYQNYVSNIESSFNDMIGLKISKRITPLYDIAKDNLRKIIDQLNAKSRTNDKYNEIISLYNDYINEYRQGFEDVLTTYNLKHRKYKDGTITYYYNPEF